MGAHSRARATSMVDRRCAFVAMSCCQKFRCRSEPTPLPDAVGSGRQFFVVEGAKVKAPVNDVEEQNVQGRPAPMRLSTHLVLSHSAPVLLLVLALGLALAALIRISVVLTTLRDAELVVMQEEGELHAAAWAVDVAMRHGEAACLRGESPDGVAHTVEEKAVDLRRVAAEASTGAIHTLALGYIQAADRLDATNACELLTGELRTRRAWLDEQLTNQWVARLQELHDAVDDKEGDARNIAITASWVGIPVAAMAVILAALIALRMARLVTLPLGSLARLAKRVGRGDFRGRMAVDGPSEVVDLARELELMREKLAQLEALKQGFVASVSHELRTPLSKVREALALLEDGAVGPTDERQMRVIRIARSACESEIRLVTTLLDLSRLRAGSPLQLRSDVSIDHILSSAIDDERQEAVSRDVAIDFEPDDQRALCRLDPMLMERVVANLIRNAVAVSKKGQRVTVSRRIEFDGPSRPGPWACITVADRGPGVPEEVRETLFDAFVTQPVPKTGKALGVGLGLALAQEVALGHGGTLHLDDTVEEGACFVLWLPVTSLGEVPPETPVDRQPSARRSEGARP